MFKKLSRHSKFLVIALVLAVGVAGAAYAQTATEFSQTINSGSLSVSILDDSQQAVATPGVVMSAITASTSCQDPGSTGTLGTNTERIYVDNPEAANSGWTLSMAATDGPTATWESGSDTIDFNDATNSGCDNGQMSIDPTTGTITTDCSGCTTTGISTGSASAFDEGIVDSIELVNAADTSDDIFRGYLTGASVSQVIPAEVPTGTYTLDMTLTVAAN